ncbi:flavodoxin [Williamwhitmania taraxaci]|uniref:Flavodoxin n=1 Tax=Williamwhitmania taraxaci TaxID=1640674 RepID=A0A1G6LHI8_9BACT|nr:flavodoxin [Williamwhitmania taraxaci]SDC42653.1 flavodoxin I [Williamwhitmania taraxaci]
MNKVGIFYGPVGGSTERVAKRIAKEFGEENVELIPVHDATAADVERFQNIIFGCSTIGKATWQADAVKKDWNQFRSELANVKVEGKTFALFGLGDHLTYPFHFVNAMGEVATGLLEKNAKIVGRCSVKEYEFKESIAVIDGEFIGLPIDEDFEAEKTESRVKNWVVRLKNKFA